MASKAKIASLCQEKKVHICYCSDRKYFVETRYAGAEFISIFHILCCNFNSKPFFSFLIFSALTTLTASICWNILAHKTDEISEMGVKIYQKPESNDIYELRRKKNPPLCKENENPDAAW